VKFQKYPSLVAVFFFKTFWSFCILKKTITDWRNWTLFVQFSPLLNATKPSSHLFCAVTKSSSHSLQSFRICHGSPGKYCNLPLQLKISALIFFCFCDLNYMPSVIFKYQCLCFVSAPIISVLDIYVFVLPLLWCHLNPNHNPLLNILAGCSVLWHFENNVISLFFYSWALIHV
jgi:hypothetical protein